VVFLALRGSPTVQAAPPRRIVRVYDAVGASAGERRSAEAQAAAVLKDAGIAVVWRECPSELDDCAAPLEATEVMVRLVNSPRRMLAADDLADSLGYSLVDVKEGRGWLATIFVDRIDRVARGANASSTRLFGRAMAHEIGHLLLGVPTHADHGLMRGRWTAAQLHRDAPLDWLMSRSEATVMRQSLAAWNRQTTTPIVVVAGDIAPDRIE
jgi:hypothetical protein